MHPLLIYHALHEKCALASTLSQTKEVGIRLKIRIWISSLPNIVSAQIGGQCLNCTR